MQPFGRQVWPKHHTQGPREARQRSTLQLDYRTSQAKGRSKPRHVRVREGRLVLGGQLAVGAIAGMGARARISASDFRPFRRGWPSGKSLLWLLNLNVDNRTRFRSLGDRPLPFRPAQFRNLDVGASGLLPFQSPCSVGTLLNPSGICPLR